MTVNLSDTLIESLRKLADTQGRDLDEILDEAVREYIVASSITDLSPEDVAAAQISLIPELEGIDSYEDGAKDPGHEAS